MTLQILPVRDARSRLGRAFFRFPFELYRDVPQWVPPFAGGVRRILERKHPFYQHSDGDAFVVLEGGRVVARYLLLDPRLYNDHTGRREARIGLPEGIDRQDVWDAVIDHARRWASERGASRLVGPRTFSPMDGAGVLVAGFDATASMTMMPYHHPYVAERIEAAGMRRYKDFLSGLLRTADFRMPEKVRRVAEISRQRSGITVVHPTGRQQLRSLGREIGELYNRSWADHEEFRPLTEMELSTMVADLARVTDARLIPLLRGPDDELVGFVLPFPDLTPALQRADGAIGLRTLIDLRLERRRTRHCIVNGLGILPAYRNRGGTALMYLDLLDHLPAAGFETVEMTQIAETTDRMLSDMMTLGAEVYKRHRVYATEL